MAWWPRRRSVRTHDILGRSTPSTEKPSVEDFKDDFVKHEHFIKESSNLVAKHSKEKISNKEANEEAHGYLLTYFAEYSTDTWIFRTTWFSGYRRFMPFGCLGLVVLGFSTAVLGSISAHLGHTLLANFLLVLTLLSLLMCGLIYLIGLIAIPISKTVAMSRLRVRGVHVTGVALDTWTERRTDKDGDYTHTEYRTKVGFIVGTDRHVVTIDGTYAVGQGVPMVYDLDNPHVANSESNIRSSEVRSSSGWSGSPSSW